MAKQLLMGNEAIAHAAIAAGVNVVCGYPGTPSTEVLETVAKHNPGDIHVEWSVNEKAAMELAAGASYSGARTLVTMKQVGLNVASDPLMSLAYIGVKGGMVVLVADDPGPISSQTEQDTRTFAYYSKLPIFDPSSPEEAYDMVADAFELSERYHIPVLLRPTTRVCHATAPLEIGQRVPHEISGFERDPKWIIFPKRAFEAHTYLNETLPCIAEDFDGYRFNSVCDIIVDDTEPWRLGIVTGGISDAYALEALAGITKNYRLFHVATPHPFPKNLALEFLDGLDEVLVLEELDPVIERELLVICGEHHLPTIIKGKLTGDARSAGENTVESAKKEIASFFGVSTEMAVPSDETAPPLPVRPPVLCAGCPHRGSFYAVKKALSGRKAFFGGDIGCYTLGNALPLDMIDTCLCMGAGITIAQGMKVVDPDVKSIAFVGDSTFFAAGITGVVNAFYNEHDITLVVLDNSTTAMTGHQPHPGTGKNVMGEITRKVDIEAVLRGIGLTHVVRANPLDLKQAIAVVKEAVDVPGVSAIIFESPCVALFKPEAPAIITADCTRCTKCIKELGCPALILQDGIVSIDESLCNGCNLCVTVCPFDAIEAGGAK